MEKPIIKTKLGSLIYKDDIQRICEILNDDRVKQNTMDYAINSVYKPCIDEGLPNSVFNRALRYSGSIDSRPLNHDYASSSQSIYKNRSPIKRRHYSGLPYDKCMYQKKRPARPVSVKYKENYNTNNKKLMSVEYTEDYNTNNPHRRNRFSRGPRGPMSNYGSVTKTLRFNKH